MSGDYVLAVFPPLEGPDMDLLRPFSVKYLGTTTHIYIPFDPDTWKLPAQVGDFKYRKVGNVVIWYSPNVHQFFLQEYIKADRQGNPYFTEFPALLVDYGTPLGFSYAGTTKPPDRPLSVQIQDWKSGYQVGKRQLPNEGWSKMEITTCTEYDPVLGCVDLKTYKFKEGYYWVNHQARLINLPATMIVGTSDVLMFTYKKPESVVFKIPGFSSIADYIIKKKLRGEGLDQVKQIVSAFGYELDYSTPYTTKGGKRVTGPCVEEVGDTYVVYVPIRKPASLGIGIGTALLAVALATIFVVGVYAILKIESMKNESFKAYVSAVIDAQNNYIRCVSSCNAFTDKSLREKCLAGCRESYETTITEAQEAWTKYSSSSTIGEVTGLLKWGVAAIIVLKVLDLISSRRESHGGE